MSRFADSAEVTAHMELIQQLLNDPRLAEWVATTDSNFGTVTSNNLERAKENMDDMLEQMYSAG